MSVRRLVAEVELGEVSVKEFCALHGISTWTFYELRRRFRAEGVAGLEPRSRAPGRVANRTPDKVRDLIVEIRKALDDQGLDSGPASIHVRLCSRLDSVPSESTIWRVLRDRGFITPAPHKAPKHAHRSFSAARANECWQIDATKWPLADGNVVEIINIIDDCTRLAVASVAVDVCTTANTWTTLCDGAGRWGLPARVLTDNAAVFRGSMHATGGIEPALRSLGITLGHSRPYHPQTCGKVERFHLTLKKFLTARPSAETVTGLQDQLDEFCHIYNHERPHRSLDRRTPAAVFATTAKDGPADRPLNAPTQMFTSIIGSRGYFNAGRRVQIAVGRAHTGKTAITLITGLHAHVFIDGHLIRALTIDPTRKYQPMSHP